MGKLAVACNDRVISFYELHDHGGMQRWAVHGKMSLVDMPLALVGWAMPDGTQCFATGDDHGQIHIYDAKRLMALVRPDDPLQAKAILASGGRDLKAISPAFTEPARLTTLALHSDWVSSLAYEESLRGLVSASLDTTIRISTFDWPPPPPRDSQDNGGGNGTSPGQQQRKIPRDATSTRAVLRCHSKGVTSVVTMQVSNRRMCASAGLEHSVFVCSLETGDLIKCLEGHKSSVVALAVDEPSETLVSLCAGGEMRTWDLATLNLVQTIAPAEPYLGISAIAFNTQHAALVTGTRRPVVWQQLRAGATKEELAATMLAPHGHRSPLVAVLYSSQFFLVVSGDEAGLICVWDVKTGVPLFRFEHRQAKLTAMRFDSSGRRLLTGAADGVVRLWNFSSGELMNEMDSSAELAAEIATPPARRAADKAAQTASATSAAFAAAANATAAALAADKDDDATRELTGVLHINQGAFQYFASVGWSRELVLHPDPLKVSKHPGSSTTAAGRALLVPRRLKGHQEDILCMAFCPPNLLATGSYDGTILVWNLQSATLKSKLLPPPDAAATSAPQLHSRSVEGVVFLESRNALLREALVVASCGADGALRFWSSRSGACMHTVEGACPPGDSLQSLCAETTSTILVSGDSAGRLKVWDLARLAESFAVKGGVRTQASDSRAAVRLLFSWRAHRHPVVHVEYLPGVEGIMSASTDCTARLWTLSGEQVGLFGQEHAWQLDKRETWLDRSRCIAGSANEGKAADLTDEQERALQPPQQQESPLKLPGGVKASPKSLPREAGRMRPEELRDLLKVLRVQRGPSPDALGGHGRHGRESESAKGDGLTRHAAVRSSAVLGKHGGDAAGRCAEVLTTATLPPVAGDAAQMRHRKVFASSTASKRWAPDRSLPRAASGPHMGSSASAPVLPRR